MSLAVRTHVPTTFSWALLILVGREGYNNNNNNNNHGFVSQDPSWEAISYLSAFVFAGLQGKKTHTHKVLWEKCTRRVQ